MRKLSIIILTFLLLISSSLYAENKVEGFTSVSVEFIVGQGIRGGFTRSIVTDFNKLTNTSGRISDDANIEFTFDERNARYAINNLYYYLQVFIPQTIKYTITCGSLIHYENGAATDTRIPASSITMSIGSNSVSTVSDSSDPSGSVLSYTYDERSSLVGAVIELDSFISDYATDDTGNRKPVYQATRKYPTLYSENISVSVPASLITSNITYSAILTLTVEVST